MLFEDKNAFRSFCKKKLFRVSRREKREAERTLEALIGSIDAKNILLYIPMFHEVGFNQLLQKRDKNLFVPFMEQKSFKMVKYRLPLQKRRFGIKEPKNSNFKRRIDVAIVPVIGVDGDFRRIGFGKGMYDRFFTALPYRPIIIFVQARACITPQQLADSFDIQGDLLVTSKFVYIREDSDVGRVVSRKFCSHFKWRCRLFRRKKNRKRSF